MPAENIAHSLAESEISARLDLLRPKLKEITNFTLQHRARLIHPMVNFDASAVALSFVPAAHKEASVHRPEYTYHHLRRDLHDLCMSTGAKVTSRYVVPSAHLTIGRFLTEDDFNQSTGVRPCFDSSKVRAFVERIEEINQWLREEHWEDQWLVGQEQGLDCCEGTLWYGYAQRVRLGEGF